MTKILALYFVVALVVVCNAAVDRESFLARVAKLTRAFAPANCSGKKVGEQICDSCTSFKFCMANETATDATQCSGNTPNCVNGKCSAQKNSDPSCAEPDITPHTCSSEGYFPNPTNCSRFYYCSGAADPVKHYECPENFVSNLPSLLCKPKKTAADCQLINCDKGKLVATYAPNKAYYAFCDGGKAIVLKCADTVHEIYDESVFDCVFRCPSEGLFPLSGNDKRYVACYNVNKNLISKEEECPAGLKFDADKLQCVK